MTMKDWGHTANVNVHLRIDLTQRIDDGKVVGYELVAIVGPVTWVGIVEPEVYDSFVGYKGKSISPCLLLCVGSMSTA